MWSNSLILFFLKNKEQDGKEDIDCAELLDSRY